MGADGIDPVEPPTWGCGIGISQERIWQTTGAF